MKKVILLFVSFVIMLGAVGCSGRASDESFPSIKESYARIPTVDWGASYEDTLKLLGLKENEVEIIYEKPQNNSQSYKLVIAEKVRLGGQNVSAILYFYDEEVSQKVGFDIGLVSARILCETKEISEIIGKQIVGTESGIITDDAMSSFVSTQKLLDAVKEKNIEAKMIDTIAALHEIDKEKVKEAIGNASSSVTRAVIEDTDDSFSAISKKLSSKTFNAMFIFNGGENYAILNNIKD